MMYKPDFRTWIISQKLADEKEKDKKNVFVCTYNPETQVSGLQNAGSFIIYTCFNTIKNLRTVFPPPPTPHLLSTFWNS